MHRHLRPHREGVLAGGLYVIIDRSILHPAGKNVGAVLRLVGVYVRGVRCIRGT